MIITALALLLAQPAPTTPAATPAAAPVRAARRARTPRAPDPERAAVMAPINAMLAALTSSDGAAILANTLTGGGATVALEGEAGQRRVRHLSWAEFAGGLRPEPGARITERLTSPQVKVDGDIAMVWARYTVRRGRQVLHCGVDHFDLVRDGGQWKVLNVTWSQRTTGCAPVRSSTTRRTRPTPSAAQ